LRLGKYCSGQEVNLSFICDIEKVNQKNMDYTKEAIFHRRSYWYHVIYWVRPLLTFDDRVFTLASHIAN